MKLTNEQIDRIIGLATEPGDVVGPETLRNIARAIGAACKPKIGGVLFYSVKPSTRPHGQIVGDDGAGDCACVIYGAPDAAEEYARKQLWKIASANRLGEHRFVRNEGGYYGPSVQIVEVSDAD